MHMIFLTLCGPFLHLLKSSIKAPASKNIWILFSTNFSINSPLTFCSKCSWTLFFGSLIISMTLSLVIFNSSILLWAVCNSRSSFVSLVPLKPVTGYSAPLRRSQFVHIIFFSYIFNSIGYTSFESQYSMTCMPIVGCVVCKIAPQKLSISSSSKILCSVPALDIHTVRNDIQSIHTAHTNFKWYTVFT